MCSGDRLVDTVDQRRKGLRSKAPGVRVVERVVCISAGSAVGVGGGDHGVGRRVRRAVGVLEAPEDLLDQAVEDQREVADHEQDPLVAGVGAGAGEDEGSGPLAGVDPL